MPRGNSLVVLLVFAVTSTSAVFATAAAEEQSVSLSEAMDIARSNSLQLKLSELGVREADFNYKQAEAASIMRPSPTMIMQAKTGLNLARQNLIIAGNDMALTVETDFYNVLKATNLLEVAQEAFASAKRHEEIAKKKYSVGTVARIDVIKSARNVLNSEANINQARHGRDLALIKFRQTLGAGLDSPIFPNEAAFSFEPVTYDVEADLDFALKNRLEIQQLELALAVAEKDVELSDNDYTAPLTLEQARINLEKVRIQLQQAKDGITLDVRQNYLAVKDAAEQIPVLAKGIEEAEETLRLSELSFEADMITSSDVQDAQVAVLKAKTDYINAVFDYNLARAKYLRAVAEVLQGDSESE